jgi:hypothetical protein
MVKIRVLILGWILSSAFASVGESKALNPCSDFIKKYCPKTTTARELSACVARVHKPLSKKCQEYVDTQKAELREAKRPPVDFAARKIPPKAPLQPETPVTTTSPPVSAVQDSPVKKAVQDSAVKKAIQVSPAKRAEERTSGEERTSSRSSTRPGAFLIIISICGLLMLGSTGFLFKKMGLNPLAGLVPFYNVYLLLREFDRPEIWNVYLYIPFVNVYFGYLLAIDIVRRFGKSDTTGLGLLIFPLFFLPYLAFGPDLYHPNYGKESTDFGPDFDLRELSRIMASRVKEGKADSPSPRKAKGPRDAKSSKAVNKSHTGPTMDIGLGEDKRRAK